LNKADRLFQVIIVRTTSVLIFLTGLLAVNRQLADRVPDRLEGLIIPINVDYTSRALDVVIGVALMYIAQQLWQRKQVAWWLAFIALAILSTTSLITSGNSYTSFYFLFIFVAIAWVRRYFRARSEVGRMRQGVLGFGLSICIAIGYGAIGFYLLDKRDFGISFDLSESIIRSIRSFVLIGNSDLYAHTRNGRWFLDSLSILGGTSVLFGIYSLFRPIAHEYTELPAERARVEALLQIYATSTDDYFKIWPHDKSFFFSHDKDAVLAYGVHSGAAIVVGDPLAHRSKVKHLIAEFDEHCLSHGWAQAFMYVGSDYHHEYESEGYDLVKLGEDAVIDLELFVAETAGNKHFRNIRNRFEKEQFSFERLSPPHSDDTLQQIAAVSRAWIGQQGHKEWQFLSGYYSKAYIRASILYIVKDSNGKIFAFANQIPTYLPNEATVDLMRYRTSSPSNIMDYLLLTALLDLKEQGYRKFNLGLAPLSGLDTSAGQPVERILDLVYRSRQNYISFKGLRQFKNKFNPTWESKYLAYKGGIRTLPLLAYALNGLMRRR
jgi:phosphatidylglycerol lysyltransferase